MAAQKTVTAYCAQLLIVLCCACADNPVGPTTPTLIIEPDQATLHELRVGSSQQLTARVEGGALNQAITWSTSDSAIARVDANGLLRIAVSYTACAWVTPGDCQVEVVAETGSLRAARTITVLPFEPTVELGSAQVNLEMGDSTRISPRVVLEGMEVPWCALSYQSADAGIAGVGAASGIVTGYDEGTTVVSVAITGRLCPTAPVRVQVTVRPPLHVLRILPDDGDVVLAPGALLQLGAQVQNWKGVIYAAPFVQWSSSDPTIATVAGGLVRVIGCAGVNECRVTMTARSGRLTARRVIIIR
jgi:hypothetical protein